VALDDDGRISAAAVAVTTPAGPAAALVRPHSPRAATLLAAIPYASVVLVSLAVPRDGVDRELDASGYLVPRVEGRLLSACSWASSKWAHLGGEDTVWLRASAGRDGDDRAMAMGDDELTTRLLDDLADTMALRGRPTEVRISRWPDSLAQYRPGHLGRVDAIEVDLAEAAPGLAVAGAWGRGVGVPACIRAGRTAARRLLADRAANLSELARNPRSRGTTSRDPNACRAGRGSTLAQWGRAAPRTHLAPCAPVVAPAGPRGPRRHGGGRGRRHRRRLGGRDRRAAACR
jgi:protoporphyrinogen oxidase